jgi:RraA family protein
MDHIGKTPEAFLEEFIARANELSSSLLSDAAEGKGVMDGGIRPVSKGKKLAGTAVTVCIRSGNLMIHLGMASAGPGHVLVVDADDCKNQACVGEMMVMSMRARGLAGFIVNGPVRDSGDLAGLDFPVFARGRFPASCNKGGTGSVNMTVMCGGVSVSPGDFVVADEDGIIVLPAKHADSLLAGGKDKKSREEERIRRIREGDLYPQWARDAARELGITL